MTFPYPNCLTVIFAIAGASHIRDHYGLQYTTQYKLYSVYTVYIPIRDHLTLFMTGEEGVGYQSTFGVNVVHPFRLRVGGPTLSLIITRLPRVSSFPGPFDRLTF